MSNLLSQASLVMIPSGYKEDVVYSQIPTSGAGDLSFTRASNGTRINSAGLVEVVPWNLVEQSETIGTSPWSAINLGITSNATTAPNGTTTAEKLMVTTANTPHQVQQGFYNDNANHTVFIYAKKAELNFIQLALGNSVEQYANFNLNTGVVGTKGTYCASSSIESVGDGWYKCSAYFNQGTIPSLMIYVTNSASSDWGGTVSFAGANNTDGIFVWGYQLNIGSTAKPYFPTTDRLNVPRLTYQNGGGGCPSLLLEKQSTNLTLYSEQFDNANWTKIDTTITANATTSPDGTQNANRLYETSTNSQHGFFSYKNALSSGTNYAVSCYVKKGNRSYCGLQFWYDVNTGVIAFFNLDNGTLVYEFAEGSGYSISNSKIESVGNGWYRLSAIVQIGITEAYPGLVMASTQWSTGTGYDNHYTGDSSKYIDVYGYQLEASSYATSYIPTTSSSATRVADACFKTGISSLIGGGTGTWFIDFEMRTETGNEYPFAFDLSDGTAGANRIFLYYAEPFASWYWGGNDTAITLPSTLRKKVAVKFSGTTAKLFCNGSYIATNTIATAFNRLDIGQRFSNTYPMDGKINEAFFLTTSLTDAECQSLTTI